MGRKCDERTSGGTQSKNITDTQKVLFYVRIYPFVGIPYICMNSLTMFNTSFTDGSFKVLRAREIVKEEREKN